MKPENKFAIAVVILLALLLCLNTFLMYRLLALERAAKTRYDWAVDIDKMPTDAKDWARMLQQQKSLYDAEMTRWRDILSTSINLMNQSILATRLGVLATRLGILATLLGILAILLGILATRLCILATLLVI
ncbi:predicted protein [Nematostella vectensis]|uniref:Uncharacterized protein n=1 Tax=Nematostella vectensis TaxID=45351 RepID=A7RTK4_NEMVE|nr:predicted protein [Nematostella vectensis]|eukprot:XP_001637345.1 predicted protein [Nematostella vectensis]